MSSKDIGKGNTEKVATGEDGGRSEYIAVVTDHAYWLCRGVFWAHSLWPYPLSTLHSQYKRIIQR